MRDWMIYGANGYTGQLIAAEAAARGWRPVLAGRSPAIAEQAAQLGLESRIFGLDDVPAIAGHLAGMRAVLHCAGPFATTHGPMLDACMAVRAHYMDLTGELPVFEALYSRGDAVKLAGIAAISGVGFDVVPTEGLAALLARDMPGATSLKIALRGAAGLSAGTAKSVYMAIRGGGQVRRAGALVPVSLTHKTLLIPFTARPSLAVTAPLAELSAAFRSTGIPDIECYIGTNAMEVMVLTAANFAPLVEAAEPLVNQAISFAAHGPDAATRRTVRAVVWGEVTDASGQRLAKRLHTPEPYALTVDAALAAMTRVLDGPIIPGAMTPSQAFGANFTLTLPGVQIENL